MKVHLKDFPGDEVYVYLEDRFRHEFFQRFLDKFKTKQQAADTIGLREGYSITRYKRGLRSCPLFVIEKISRIIREKLENVEKHILWIKRGKNKKVGSSRSIHYPKFPIVLDKNLATVLGHITGDGCVHIKNNTGCPVLSYSNNDIILIEKFKKALDCFGRVGYKEVTNTIYVPSIVGMIILKFGCKSSSLTAEVPEIIMNAKETIKANFLRALFEDDGYVSLNLTDTNKPMRLIGMCCGSQKLIDQIKDILLSMGIHVHTGTQNNYPYLFMSDRKAMIKFKEKIGFTDGYYKQILLDKLVMSYKKFQNKPGKSREAILKLLKESGPLRTDQISRKLSMKRGNVSYHLQRLKSSGVVESLPPQPIQDKRGILKGNIPSLWFLEK